MAAASYITLGIAGYLLLVRLLRYRAVDNLQSSYRIKYGSKTPFESMTFTEAQAIINHMAMYEFPFTFLKRYATILTSSEAVQYQDLTLPASNSLSSALTASPQSPLSYDRPPSSRPPKPPPNATPTRSC
jgi:hypothetical protein